MDLKKLISEIVELPTLPQVAVTLMNLLDDPSTSANEINRVMARDPALASKILKLVNSAYYGLSNKVSSLNQSIVILGFRTVKSVALSASVMGLFKGPKRSGLFDRTQFWKHSIVCACVARLTAGKQRGMDVEMAFSAGLLHDIGKQVMEHYAPEETDQVITTAEKERCSFIEAERMLFDVDHAELGGWLAETWDLPRGLQDAIKEHHDTANMTSDPQMTAVIQFANYLAKVKGMGGPGSFEEPGLAKIVWELLEIEKSDLPELVATINQEIEAVSSWIALAD